jgi:hypothetical protein
MRTLSMVTNGKVKSVWPFAVEIVGVADVHQIDELGLVREATRRNARSAGSARSRRW